MPLQLYSLATPNGQKAAIALEYLQLEYEAHLINIQQGDQFKPEFIAINPNSKIPALIDPTGDHGQPLAIMESAAILVYLAEKTGRLLPTDSAGRSRVMQWLFWQVGGVGPMFGQFGHFYRFAKESEYALNRYTNETKRLLRVLDTQLSKHAYVANDQLSIADIAIMPWVECLSVFYQGQDILELDQFSHVNTWKSKLLSDPAIAKGMTICRLAD